MLQICPLCRKFHTSAKYTVCLEVYYTRSFLPEDNDASRRKLCEDHLLCVTITVAGQVTKLWLGKLYVRPHVQYVTLKSIDDVGMLLKLAWVIPSDESGLEHNLLDNPRYSEGWDVSVIGVWVWLFGYGPLLWIPERSVSHEDHGLMGGGAVAGHSNDLLRHLININLEKEN